MSILTDKFQMVTKDPLPGAYGGLWDVLVPREMYDASASGSGPGVPDSAGTVEAGTLLPGTLLMMDSTGSLVKAVSPNVSSAMPVMIWVAMEGDVDYSASYAGMVTVVHGGMRVETTLFVAGSSYTPGVPLIAASGGDAGKLDVKAAAGDHIQIVGYVGPNGVNSDGVLDAYLVQGVTGA